MQNIEIFDLIIITITLLLGIKGLFNGIIKEMFGIFAIIGSIFLSSRFSDEAANFITPVLSLENQTTAKLIGFIISLFVIWFIIYSIGVIISKIFSASGLGIIDRLFGLFFGMAKIFLIFSVIAYVLSQVSFMKKIIDDKSKTSITLPYLIDIGSYIIKIDINDYKPNSLNEAIDSISNKEKNSDINSNSTNEKESSNNDISDDTEENLDKLEKAYKNNDENVQDANDLSFDITNQISKEANKIVNETIKEKIEDSLKSTQEKLKEIVNKNPNN